MHLRVQILMPQLAEAGMLPCPPRDSLEVRGLAYGTSLQTDPVLPVRRNAEASAPWKLVGKICASGVNPDSSLTGDYYTPMDFGALLNRFHIKSAPVVHVDLKMKKEASARGTVPCPGYDTLTEFAMETTQLLQQPLSPMGKASESTSAAAPAPIPVPMPPQLAPEASPGWFMPPKTPVAPAVQPAAAQPPAPPLKLPPNSPAEVIQPTPQQSEQTAGSVSSQALGRALSHFSQPRTN